MVHLGDVVLRTDTVTLVTLSKNTPQEAALCFRPFPYFPTPEQVLYMLYPLYILSKSCYLLSVVWITQSVHVHRGNMIFHGGALLLDYFLSSMRGPSQPFTRD